MNRKIKTTCFILLISVPILGLLYQLNKNMIYEQYFSRQLLLQIDDLTSNIYYLEEAISKIIDEKTIENKDKFLINSSIGETVTIFNEVQYMASGLQKYELSQDGLIRLDTILSSLYQTDYKLNTNEVIKLDNESLDNIKIFHDLLIDYKEIINLYYIENIPNEINDINKIKYSESQIKNFRKRAINNNFWIEIISEMNSTSNKYPNLIKVKLFQ